MRILAGALGFVSVLGMASAGWAHARLLAPLPRTPDADLKTGPCGGIGRTASPTTFQVGSVITVQWEETIQHTGYFRIRWSNSGDKGFTILADNIPKIQNQTQYSKQVTLPSTPCTGCTLQLIQVMEDRDPPSNYFSCADIVLTTEPPPDPPADAGTPADGAADPADDGSAPSVTDSDAAVDHDDHVSPSTNHVQGSCAVGDSSVTPAGLFAVLLLIIALRLVRSRTSGAQQRVRFKRRSIRRRRSG